MAVTQDLPGVQLFEQVFASVSQRESYSDLSGYLEAGGSVFPLVERGVQGLVRDFGLSADDAQVFLWRANALAIHVRRLFIEHRRVDDNATPVSAQSGLLSMVLGPSFERLFNPRFSENCLPDALESFTSPVAYLIELVRWVQERIESVGDGQKKMPLLERRTDLLALTIDDNAVNRAWSSVDIIIKVLEAFIRAHANVEAPDAVMALARYPNGLPYYQPWATIDFVARQNGHSVGSIAHLIDSAFPYFLQPDAWDDDAGRALLHASRLGPQQRSLLTEQSVVSADKEAFYEANFGGVGLTWQNLSQVQFFCERTKLDTTRLEALLSVRRFVPLRSANAPLKPGDPAIPDGAASGSVYINAGRTPAIGIDVRAGNEQFNRLTADVNDPAPYDRMNRKVRLDQWLDLPSDQVDALLVAASRAQSRGGPTTPPWWISDSTVQALGLFQTLRERYGCTAEDFAVFIDELSIYGRGEVLSSFDRTFNIEDGYRNALILDEGAFAVFPGVGVSELTVNLLCHGLGIDLQTYRYLAMVIAQAHGRTDTLIRSPAIISSFYRLVRLPRLLGITPIEGVLMLALLGADRWLGVLAGVPTIKTVTAQDPPNVLNIIHALDSCARWCDEQQMSVSWMVQQASVAQMPAASTVDELQLFDQVRNLLSGAFFTNTALLMAGVPALAGGADWLDLLTSLVDNKGLVINPRHMSESDYRAHARARLLIAVRDGFGGDDDVDYSDIVDKMSGVLLQVRGAQQSVVKECLAVYAGLDSERVLAVIEWTNISVDYLLRQVLDRSVQIDAARASGLRWEAPVDPFLQVLAEVRRRSAVVMKLDLSPELLRDYLEYGHLAWMGQADKYALTVNTLYDLTVLNRAFAASESPASTLLDYLRQVHALPDPLTGDALSLAQQAASIKLARFFAWSVQEVRECANRVDPQRIIRNLRQLDLLMRVRALAMRTGMDAQTIFLIGALPATLNEPAYETAAGHALLSLSEQREPLVAVTGEIDEQVVTMTCSVNATQVIANKPGETITFTVTVRDLEARPVSGVEVHWETELGSFNKSVTRTDGVAVATFTPGAVMGTVTPVFWLDLQDKHYAPTVEIIADATSMMFPLRYKSREPLGIVPRGQEVELYAGVQDSHGNVGANMLVDWLSETSGTGTAIIRPSQGFTNQQGLTRVFVSSRTGGVFEFGVLIQASDTTLYFEAITFAGDTLPG